jgi:hypothetical protein
MIPDVLLVQVQPAGVPRDARRHGETKLELAIHPIHISPQFGLQQAAGVNNIVETT